MNAGGIVFESERAVKDTFREVIAKGAASGLDP
jgi:hypothetical protein